MHRGRNVLCVSSSGAHHDRVVPLITPIREACTRCRGNGLLASGSRVRECPTCEGAGAVWTGDDPTIAATIQFLMATCPDGFIAPTGRRHPIVGDRPYEPPPQDTP